MSPNEEINILKVSACEPAEMRAGVAYGHRRETLSTHTHTYIYTATPLKLYAALLLKALGYRLVTHRFIRSHSEKVGQKCGESWGE